MDIIDKIFTPKNAIVGLVILFIIIIVYIFVPRSNFHGGSRHFGRRGGWWGRWNGFYYPYYYNNTYIIPNTTQQKIGYAVSDDGTIVLDILHGGDNLYMYSNNGTIVKTENRDASPKNEEKISAIVNGVNKVFVVHLT